MRRWPEMRAGLIAIAIGFGLIDGCPLASPADTPAWERGFVDPLRRIQAIAEAPVAWIRPWLRITQRWALYQAPGRDRYRMSIEGEAGDNAWQVLYRVGDPAHTEHADVIEYARVRSAWDPMTVPSGQYPLFAAWVTARVLSEHPTLRSARVRYEKLELSPDGIASTGIFVFTYVRTRGQP